MTIILIGVVAVAFIVGMIWLSFFLMRIDRASNQRIERRREAWRAGGCVGPEPGKYPSAPEREDWEGGCVGGISGGGNYG